MRLWLVPLFAAVLSAQTQQAGKYQITLRLPADGLSAQEEMQIEYRVVDSSRVDPVMGASPVIRAQARSVIEMPTMPGMAKLLENVHPEGVPGEYGLHPVFPHGGEYRLQLFVTPPGEREFSVEFPLAVGDAAIGKAKKPKPYYAELRATPRSPKVGQAVELVLEVYSRLKGKERITQFDTVHERPMHLIVVRQDLGVFAHEHPTMDADGRFRLRYTFAEGGEYTLFADAAPQGAGSQVMPVRLRVAGAAGPAFTIGASAVSGEAKTGSLRVTFAQTRYAVGRTMRVECGVVDLASGNAVKDLEPYLGALGHLILVHEDGQTFVHSHPDERGPLAFLVRFPKAGRYRAWVQMQRAGVVETGAFTVEAGAP